MHPRHFSSNRDTCTVKEATYIYDIVDLEQMSVKLILGPGPTLRQNISLLRIAFIYLDTQNIPRRRSCPCCEQH